MIRVPESLQHFGPSTLAQFALGGALRDFLVAYGDTAFLLVSVEDADIELRHGLVACEQVTGTTAQPTLAGAAHVTNSAEVTTVQRDSSHLPGVLDEAGLGDLLRTGRHYAISLRKRTPKEAEPRITVGRSRSRDIVLRDSRVSKHHAQFEMDEDGEFHLADAGSTNGTYLDGRRLAPEQLVMVPEGAAIHFGGVRAFLVRPGTLWKILQPR